VRADGSLSGSLSKLQLKIFDETARADIQVFQASLRRNGGGELLVECVIACSHYRQRGGEGGACIPSVCGARNATPRLILPAMEFKLFWLANGRTEHGGQGIGACWCGVAMARSRVRSSCCFG
jgi:hypothetical protein